MDDEINEEMGGASEPMGETENVYRVLIGRPTETDRLEHTRVGRNIIFK
jgi:hypothetical protein